MIYTNSIYLYLHRALIRHSHNEDAIRINVAIGVIGKYITSVPKSIRREVLKDMVHLKLLEKEKRNFIRIINKDKSLVMVERFPEIKQKQDEGSWWR